MEATCDRIKRTVDFLKHQPKRGIKKVFADPEFYFTPEEFLLLIRNCPVNQENLELIEKKFSEATKNIDKRSYEEQKSIRQKYQPTHGLCLKNIPFEFDRSDTYKAIQNLKTEFTTENGDPIHFPGQLSMMQFMFPKIKDKRQHSEGQTAFPIFKSRTDRDILWRCAVKNATNSDENLPRTSYDRKGLIYLPHPNSGNYALINVELVRNDIGIPMNDVATDLSRIDKITDSFRSNDKNIGFRSNSSISNVASYSNSRKNSISDDDLKSFGYVGKEKDASGFYGKVVIPDDPYANVFLDRGDTLSNYHPLSKAPSLSSLNSDNSGFSGNSNAFPLNRFSVKQSTDHAGNPVTHVSDGNSLATALTDQQGNVHVMMSDNNNKASLRYFQRRVSSVQRGGNIFEPKEESEEPIFNIPSAVSEVQNFHMPKADREVSLDNLTKLTQNVNLNTVPNYQQWAFQGENGSGETDVRAGLANFNKQESTQTVVENENNQD